MSTRITFFCLLLLSLSNVYSQDKQEVTISDSLLKLEKEAKFPGGPKAWENFLRANLNASVPVDNGAPAGRYTVQVQFIVDKEGKASEFKALTKWGYGMEQEVIRVLKKSGDWEPATMMGGKLVKAYRKQPITFFTEVDGYDVTTATPHTLYVGIDNPVTVTAHKIKTENLQVTVSKNATIKSTGDNTYIVKVNKPDERVIFTLTDTKKNRTLSTHSIEAKLLPTTTK